MKLLSRDISLLKKCISNVYDRSGCKSANIIVPFRHGAEVWLPVSLTREWESENGLAHITWLLNQEFRESGKKAKRFVGWLIFAVISAVVTLAPAAVSVAALRKIVQDAETVKVLLANVTEELWEQEAFDEEIMVPLTMLEATVLWLRGQGVRWITTWLGIPEERCVLRHCHAVITTGV